MSICVYARESAAVSQWGMGELLLRKQVDSSYTMASCLFAWFPRGCSYFYSNPVKSSSWGVPANTLRATVSRLEAEMWGPPLCLVPQSGYRLWANEAEDNREQGIRIKARCICGLCLDELISGMICFDWYELLGLLSSLFVPDWGKGHNKLLRA